MSAEVRLQARDPAHSSLVQAPAGSGKTELLTQRILALLAIVEEPEEILALTFTRKAAAEMRSRVIEALKMDRPSEDQSHRLETWQLAQQALKRSEAREWNLCDYPGRLRLMTLDSLTHALASQLPLLSGLGEMPRPGEYLLPAYREAAEAGISQLQRDDADAAEILLLHHDHQMSSLIELVAAMLAKREQWLPLIARHGGDMAAARSDMESLLETMICEAIGAVAAMIPIGIRHALPPLLRFAGEQRGDDALISLADWPDAEVTALPKWQLIASELMTKDGFRKPGGINASRGFPAGKAFAAEKLQFQEMLSQLADIDGLQAAMLTMMKLPASPHYDEQQWQVLEAMFRLLLFSAQRLQPIFSRNGEADFTEIALRALQALEDEAGMPSDLLLRLDYRIHHILVDEFQDTSLLQMRLLHSLTAGWQQGDGVHRTLFMVGDPMQSIYRFRKAEVGLFLQAAANQAGLPEVEPLQLERNFRSSPLIVGWVNRAFSKIFPGEQDAVRGAVSHSEATAALDHAGTVRLTLQRGSDKQREAAAILQLIERERILVNGSGQPKRIALLARSRRQLHSILQALEAVAIPFRAINILPLYDRYEIRLLRALVRALLHPYDRASWAALLTAPCCGLTTADLHNLMAGDERPLWQIINDSECSDRLSGDGGVRVTFVAAALAPCVAVAGRVALRELIESAWQRLAMPQLIDATASLNVEAAFELIEAIDEGGLLNFRLFDERLEQLYAAPDVREEAAQIELLTMHGAKGLQWDTVILPGLGDSGRSGDAPLLAFTDVAKAGDVVPLMAARAAVRSEDAIFKLVNSIEKAKYDYELARLLYVACTRAESALHMFGHVSESTEKASSGSLLNLLLPDGAGGGCFGAESEWLEELDPVAAPAARGVSRVCEPPRIGEAEPAEPEPFEAEYFWAGPEAAPVGNAVHALLQKIGECGIEQWGTAERQSVPVLIRRLLIADGLSGEMLENGAGRAVSAVDSAIASERGRWILSGEHADAHCEWALSSFDGHVAHHIIDRSFIDADGVRWIIDYKTASHEGGDLGAFLDEEVQRYAAQLQRYAEVLTVLEPGREIKAALYFPMLDVWREVPPVTSVDTSGR